MEAQRKIKEIEKQYEEMKIKQELREMQLKQEKETWVKNQNYMKMQWEQEKEAWKKKEKEMTEFNNFCNGYIPAINLQSIFNNHTKKKSDNELIDLINDE